MRWRTRMYNNSLNQTRPHLSVCVMIRQIASVACSQVGTWARRLAQKGWTARNGSLRIRE